jgi:hypothetical protein
MLDKRYRRAANVRSCKSCENVACKYMTAGVLSHRLCHRAGRCVGCPTEEAALARGEAR